MQTDLISGYGCYQLRKEVAWGWSMNKVAGGARKVKMASVRVKLQSKGTFGFLFLFLW
jgi:hypothetical protein